MITKLNLKEVEAEQIALDKVKYNPGVNCEQRNHGCLRQ